MQDAGAHPRSSPADWHYIGHYGQLGPLTREQIEELVIDGVIERDTYVWKTGMADWMPASQAPELREQFASMPIPPQPPPAPGFAPPPVAPVATRPSNVPYGPSRWSDIVAYAPPSDRNRYVAGILQILIPGSGRMYLGYVAQGILQLVLTPLGCGIGYVWSLVDGIIILAGGVRHDGYGRRLEC